MNFHLFAMLQASLDITIDPKIILRPPNEFPSLSLPIPLSLPTHESLINQSDRFLASDEAVTDLLAKLLAMPDLTVQWVKVQVSPRSVSERGLREWNDVIPLPRCAECMCVVVIHLHQPR